MKILFNKWVVMVTLLTCFQANAAEQCNISISPDDSLQQAVANLPADNSKQIICLTEGQFVLPALLHIDRNNVVLRGQGKGSQLSLLPGLQQPVIVIGDYKNAQPRETISNITLENFAITGNSGGKEFMPELPYLSNSGVVVRKGNNMIIRGLTVENCRSACLLTEHQSSNIVIENNRVSRAQWDGVSFNSSSQILLRNNVISDNVAAAVTAENVEDSEISHNELSHNGSHAVYLSDSYRNLLSDNQILNNNAAAIFLTCAIRSHDPLICWDNSLASDNIIESNTIIGNPYSYAFGVNKAANCKGESWPRNQWRNNRSDAEGWKPDPEKFGVCLEKS